MHLLQRNAPLSRLAIFSPVWSVCTKQTSGGFAHTKTHYSRPTRTSSVESESNRFKDGCSEANQTEMLF